MSEQNHYIWDADELLSKCKDNWDIIAPAICPSIKSYMKKGSMPCPIHNGKGSNFRLSKKFAKYGHSVCYSHCGSLHISTLIRELNGWSYPEFLNSIADYLGLESDSPKIKLKSKSEIAAELAERKAKEDRRDNYLKKEMNTAWSTSCLFTAPPAEPARKYCKNRAIDITNFNHKVIRFHPNLESKFFNKITGLYESEGFWPCILLMVKTPRGRLTIHRHYITPDGLKAPVSIPKRIMGYLSGSCDRGMYADLFQSNSRIGAVGEGFESSACLSNPLGIPVYPTINAWGLETFDPSVLPQHDVWIIFGDKDVSSTGQNAAIKLKQKIERLGKTAHIFLPPMPIPKDEKSIDWNDVMMRTPDYVMNLSSYVLDLAA